MKNRQRTSLVVAITSISLALAASVSAQDPFADEVVSFVQGTTGGFGAGSLPDIVLGPPVGSGDAQGSLDVLSLGNNGVVVLRFDTPVICDAPGVDFTVFENAFLAGGMPFAEYGIVAVSQDGIQFFDLPYDATTHAGLAGQTPVFSNPGNGIDPTDPAESGGDSFDLADVGLAWAAYVRITDPGATIADPGNSLPSVNTSGFDLDAIAAVHACDPETTPAATATPTNAAATATATRTPTPNSTATPTAGASGGCAATPITTCDDGNPNGVLQLKSAAKNRLQWKRLGGTPPNGATFGDPTLSTQYSLCIYGTSAGSSALAFSTTLPNGSKWKRLKKGGFLYRDPSAASGGIIRAVVHPNVSGSGKIVISGKGAALDLPQLPLPQVPQVIVQLRNDAGGCWQAVYDAPAIKTTDSIFKDESH